MPKYLDLTGQRFGRLTVLRGAGRNRHGQHRFECRCDCGTIKVIQGYYLTSGDTKSCGCFVRVSLRARGKKGVPDCLHCRQRVGSNGRGLCGVCVSNPALRELYPKRSTPLHKPRCLHCRVNTAGTRGLCKPCYHNPAIRRLHPKILPKKCENLVGRIFSHLTVIEPAEPPKPGSRAWLCRCKCGRNKMATTGVLTNGNTKSCGCGKYEKAGLNFVTHGATGTPEYACWLAMKQRCTNPASASYHRYGGAGVTVCDQWLHSFELFLRDVGKRPSPGMTLDRIDNTQGYAPGNVRWADQKTQARNKRSRRDVTFKGETKCLAQWADDLCLPYNLIRGRLVAGMSPEKAFSLPVPPPPSTTVSPRRRHYGIFRAMIQRCEDVRCKVYACYGGRGISVCGRWRGKGGFKKFLADMGYRPSVRHSLDRIDNDGPYSPDNCRWATMSQQAANTRRSRLITHDGVTRCLSEWARAAGLTPHLVARRLEYGWSFGRAINTPRRQIVSRY